MAATNKPETRIQSPPGVSQVELATDFPDLLPLLNLSPTILIYTKSSPHFRSIWLAPNCRASQYPRAIIRPRSEAEVSDTLRLASGKRLPLTIRGGGHDSYGRSTLEDGIVLDMRALDSITLNSDKTFAHVGGGVLAGKLLSFLAIHDVFVPMGYCSTVGYTGWALGGGFGVFTAIYGAGAENIVGARVVTVDGHVIDTDDDKELLWGLRGAGNGNFGVVVELRVKVYTPPPVLGGWVGFPNSEAEVVLGGFEKMCDEDMPVEFNGDVIFSRIPDAGPVVMFMYVWTAKEGDLDKGYKHLERIKSLGTVVVDSVVETNPHEFLTLLNATFKEFVGDPFYVESPTMARYTSTFGRIIASNPTPEGGHVIGGTHNVHGIVETPNKDVVLPNRKHITLTLFGAVDSDCDPDGPELKAVKDWVDKFAGEIEAEGLGLKNGYVSFSRSNVDLDSFYGKEDAQRLRALKRRYDPENFFFLAYPTLI